jgi:hypothetical protein
MKIFSAQLKGTTVVVEGATASITGSFTGSIAGIDINSTNEFTASTIARLNSIETISSSNDGRVGSIELFTSSTSARLNSIETISASNISRLGSLEAKTGSLATTGSNTFIGTQTITGSLYISSDLIVQGSSSLQNITASAVSIGTNLINLNTANPAIRYAGLVIGDSGSIGSSGSFLYDSVQDEMIFVHRGANTTVTSSVVLMGPQTYDNIGGETYPSINLIQKGTGNEHLVDSCIFDNGTTTCVKNNLIGTGTINSVGLLTGQASIYQADAGGLIASNRWGVYNGGATTMRFLYNASGNVIWDNGNEKMVLTNTGDLGIGVSTPQSIFHIIKGLGNDVIKIGESGTNTRLAIGQEAAYTGNYINSRNIDLKLQAYCAGGSGGNIHLQTGTDGTGCVTTKLLIARDGAATFSSTIKSKGIVAVGASGGYTTGDNTYINLGGEATTDNFGAINMPFGDAMKFNSYHGYQFKTSNSTASPVTMFSIGINGAASFANTVSIPTLTSLTRKYETNAVSFSTQAGGTGTFNIDIAGLSGLGVAGNYQTADVYFQAGLYPGATTINGRIGVVARGGANTANLYAITCIGGLGVVTITPYGNGTSTFGLCLQSNCTASFVYWKAIVNAMSV